MADSGHPSKLAAERAAARVFPNATVVIDDVFDVPERPPVATN
jgi:hypothetical protein